MNADSPVNNVAGAEPTTEPLTAAEPSGLVAVTGLVGPSVLCRPDAARVGGRLCGMAVEATARNAAGPDSTNAAGAGPRSADVAGAGAGVPGLQP
ncbi:MAG: hypothetical protein ACRDP6_37790, partial [Actinoallomurus sp.]